VDQAAVDITEPSPTFLAVIPHEVARRHLVFGARESPDHIVVRHTPDLPAWSLGNLALQLGKPVRGELADPESIAREIDGGYARRQSDLDRNEINQESVPLIALGDEPLSAADLEAELSRTAATADSDLLNTEQKGPIPRLVDVLLFESIGRGASDIHIQPLADEVLVRYRVDGVLATARSVPLRLAAGIVSRIKVMARMDVAERRAPQDGRATVVIGRGRSSVGGNGVGGKAVDLRISTLPTSFGERVVIRLLYADQASDRATMESLGMPQQVAAAYLDRAGRSSGIVLVTGPTGSGKTTTLYATLRWIIGRSSTGGRAADVNVLTIEDPIEYDLSAAATQVAGTPRNRSLPISQTQVDPKKGLTFASGLRHILRQDPDIIMVGEIRDAETARIAIQASLTGHAVFSTLHTNDAPSAISRLIDLEVEPFLICSTVSAVLAQRLVRLVHRDCRGEGCPGCLGTGFKGRRGLFELLLMNDSVRELVAQRESAALLRDAAVAGGMRTLSDEGRRLIEEGLTTIAEVQRVTLGVE
jgi:type II secretory ATPase GspE/PulE/Tfp pilus assembly ATPase PilB-like protein